MKCLRCLMQETSYLNQKSASRLNGLVFRRTCLSYPQSSVRRPGLQLSLADRFMERQDLAGYGQPFRNCSLVLAVALAFWKVPFRHSPSRCCPPSSSQLTSLTLLLPPSPSTLSAPLMPSSFRSRVLSVRTRGAFNERAVMSLPQVSISKFAPHT